MPTRNPNLTLQTESSVRDLLSPIKRIRESDPDIEGPLPGWWWTGAQPEACAGWMNEGWLSSLPLPNLQTVTRKQTLDYFNNTWTLTELLFSGIKGDMPMYMPPYHQLRHPLIFYYGHVAALYVNKLRLAGLLERPINPLYEQLFETGVDEMSWDDLSQSSTAWPSVREVNSYRSEVYQAICAVIEKHPGLADGHAPITQSDPLWALFMGFEHERIHLETSSVLMRELPAPLLRRPEGWAPDHPSCPIHDCFEPSATNYPRNPMVHFEASDVQLGKPIDWPSFGWDNEYGHASIPVSAFDASKFKVSNGEFLEFVRAGGYRDQSYWTEEGWRWRVFRNCKWPTFWCSVGPANLHQYRLRTLFDVRPMPWSWPAEVNLHEAEAYLAWRTEQDGVAYRLPFEREWQQLRGGSSMSDAGTTNHAALTDVSSDAVMCSNGGEMRTSHGLNINLAYGSQSPVDTMQGERFGVARGNVWEWVGDDFHPLNGFKVHELYDDFSTPCFDGEHNMLMGGSFISTGDEASIFARFHFRPHFFQHAGFRLVAGAATEGPIKLSDAQRSSGGAGYDSEILLSQYMTLHYGTEIDMMPFPDGPHNARHFPQRCAALLSGLAEKLGAPTKSALDIGCAVGGSSFALASSYDKVIGVDLSPTFIGAAQRMRDEGSVAYFRRDQGELGERVVATLPSGKKGEVVFRRADACALPPDFIAFDGVLVANLLCRIPSPRACLGRLGGPRGLVSPGGLVAIASPYSWMEEHTPRGAWLGGFMRDGQPVLAQDTLRNLLNEQSFQMVHQEDMPLLIREHERKYQYVVAHMMVFQRQE